MRELRLGDDAARIGDAHRFGRVGGTIVGAGLDERDLQRGILRQARGERRARRSRADDDEIILHRAQPSGRTTGHTRLWYQTRDVRCANDRDAVIPRRRQFPATSESKKNTR